MRLESHRLLFLPHFEDNAERNAKLRDRMYPQV